MAYVFEFDANKLNSASKDIARSMKPIPTFN